MEEQTNAPASERGFRAFLKRKQIEISPKRYFIDAMGSMALALFATLRSHGIAVVPHAFADHHRYTAEDLRFGSDLPVLMTEKDAVKCMRFAGDRHYSVPVSGQLPEAFWIALLDRLAKLR